MKTTLIAAAAVLAIMAANPAFARGPGSGANNAGNDFSRWDSVNRHAKEKDETTADRVPNDDAGTMTAHSHDHMSDDKKSMDKEAYQSSRGNANDAKDTTSGR